MSSRHRQKEEENDQEEDLRSGPMTNSPDSPPLSETLSGSDREEDEDKREPRTKKLMKKAIDVMSGRESRPILAATPKFHPNAIRNANYDFWTNITYYGVYRTPEFHGDIPKEFIYPLLEKDGDFVRRISYRHGFATLVITLRWHDVIHNYFSEKLEQSKFMTQHWKEYVERPPSAKLTAVIRGPRNIYKRMIRPIPRPEYYVFPPKDMIVEDKLTSMMEDYEHAEMRVARIPDLNNDLFTIKKQKTRRREDTLKLYKEAEISNELRHPNIIRFMFQTCMGPPVILFYEQHHRIDISQYFQDNYESRKQSCALSLSRQIASAMAYIASKNIIYRCLEGRNCHVEQVVWYNPVPKLVNFAFAHRGTEAKLRRKGLPARWMSPETIRDSIFSQKTDVWSFGVLLFEIFGYSMVKPFEDMKITQVIDRIKNAPMPLQPLDTFINLAVVLMVNCFNKDPNARPTFETIEKRLTDPDEYQMATVNEATLKVLADAGKSNQNTPVKEKQRKIEKLFKVFRKDKFNDDDSQD